MTKSRLEAFTDGVVAIVLRVLVLEIKIPNTSSFHSLWVIRNTLLAYTISFIFVAVIWVNHHRIFQMAERITEWSGRISFALLADFMSFCY